MEYVRHVRHSCLFYRWEDVKITYVCLGFLSLFPLYPVVIWGWVTTSYVLLPYFWGDQHLFLQRFLGTSGRLLTHPFRLQEGPTEFNEQYPTASERPWVDIGLVRQGCGVAIWGNPWKRWGNPWEIHGRNRGFHRICIYNHL